MNTRSNLALLDSVLNAIKKKALPIFTPQGRATVEINGGKNSDAADIYAFLENGTCVACLRITMAEVPTES